MKRTLRRSRPGFSIMEILTAVAVIAIIAAILVSNSNPETPNDRARYAAAADALNNLAQAIAGYEPTKARRSFHQVVGVYPGHLADLTTPILTTGTNKNICGAAYLSTNVSNWANAANPFYGSQLLAAGTRIAPGFTVQDALVLLNAAAASGNSANTMIIRMPTVTLADANGLDLAVDGAVNGTLGIIRYSSASDPTVVDYYITISVTTATFPTSNC
jgi:prepilin-type N-terminal cleavage/methylation domain-containing protein